jgi:CelD/BcsL family acetyltransferase involved in cellulose biosynthesis
MSVLTTTVGASGARDLTRRTGYHIELLADWRQAAAGWGGFDPSTPFQHPQWVAAWYGAFANTRGIVPLIAVITDASTGERTALLPLILRKQDGIRIVEFADLDLTDYNAPLLGAAAPRDARTARRIWRDLLAALRKMPGGADLIRLRKLPLDLDGRPNPLALLDAAGPCSLNGNLVNTGEDYDAWRYQLERTARKELERSWRVFARHPGAGFRLAADADEALKFLAATEVQQGTRMRSLGLDFILNEAGCADFYRSLVRDGAATGYAVASALTAGEEIVATLLGIRTGSRYVMIRISNAGGQWANCSPGRLIIERTMAALHEDGVREFDFSIGNYAYKRRFGVTRTPLVDLSAALSWRGVPHALRDRAVRRLRRCPRFEAVLKRALGKPLSREES